MTAFILRRLLQAIPTLLVASLVIFSIIHLVPGDAATVLAGPDATQTQLDAVRARLGLDEPLWRQYVMWLGNAVTADFGTSYLSRVPVTELIAHRLPATLLLAGAAMSIAVVVGLTGGIIAALHENRFLDRILSPGSAVGIALPQFWFGILLILTFSLYLGWLPPGGYIPLSVGVSAGLKVLILPAIALSLNTSAMLSRYTRATMVETLQDDYVRTARAKGVSMPAIVVGHALRNALIPVMTVLGIQFGRLIGGAVVIESVFAWPGIGRLLITSIEIRDFAVVQAVLLLVVVVFIVVNLSVDLIYGVLDPRVRLTRSADQR